MKLAFITGITGQDGSYLAELLLEKGYKVYGIKRRTSKFETTRIDNIRNKIHLEYGDMTDGSCLSKCIHMIINQDFEILEIYNLAAQSHVGISFDTAEYTAEVDAMGCMKILEIIKSLPCKDKIRFYQASTSEMFGDVLEIPQNENTPFNPVSPYAAAKLFAHNLVKIYREGYGIYAVSGVLFNHESPRRGENFLTMKVVNAVNAIHRGELQYVVLGNLDSKRDWGHAKDYVRGMWMMLQQNIPKDYVLATGNTISVREFVEKAFWYKGYQITWSGEGLNEIGTDQNGIIRVKISKEYFRPCEVDYLLGDPSKAEKELGWPREYNLDMIIDDMFQK